MVIIEYSNAFGVGQTSLASFIRLNAVGLKTHLDCKNANGDPLSEFSRACKIQNGFIITKLKLVVGCQVFHLCQKSGLNILTITTFKTLYVDKLCNSR